MPKVKDLGVTVVPKEFGPMEIGPGGGCYYTHWCTDCTNVPFSICGTTPGGQVGAARVGAPGGGCTDCTTQQFSICGTSPGPCTGGTVCSDCTTQAFSICGTTPCKGGTICSDCTTQQFSLCGTTPCAGGSVCSDCTTQQFSICGTSPCAGGSVQCTDCTKVPFSICGTSPQFCTDCTHRAFSLCGVSPVGPACRFNSIDPFTPHCGGTVQTPCGGSFGDPFKRGGGLTQEGINQIRTALNAQLAALEEAEKKIGPQTAEEIEAREKEIAAELDRLKTAKANLKKK